MNPNPLAGVAYSYLRFSSRKQERGDSIRRQTATRDAWLDRHPGVTLDPLTLSDLGVSAFRGRHRADDKTALSQFLRAVEAGRVKAGSFLIVESLDRLTREELGDAFELVLSLVNRGVRIVQLSPAETILEKPVNMTGLMLAIVELSRGRGESQRKSDLIGGAWARKRVECRETGKIVTRGAKAWLELRDGRFVFKPGAKALIRRIFKMATAGHGCRGIARTLISEGVPAWTRRGWYEMYVRVMLRGREVLGEFQQARYLPSGKRVFDGDPIPGYYPAAVTEAEWAAAQAAARARDNRGGRPAKRDDAVNVFPGLLGDARSGDRLHVITHGGGVRHLMPEGYKRRGEDATSFPLLPFERAVLSKLAEIDPAEVLGLGRDDGPDEAAELAAKVARLDAQLKALADQFDEDERDAIPEIAAKVRAKNAERKAAVEALDRANLEAASPLSAAWGECKGLIEALEQAKDRREARVRLRQAIARVVERIDCLFVGGVGSRAAAVQVRFAGGAHRDYLIRYRRAHGASGRPAACDVRSLKLPGKAGELDLRNHADVAALEKLLGGLDLAKLAEGAKLAKGRKSGEQTTDV